MIGGFVAMFGWVLCVCCFSFYFHAAGIVAKSVNDEQLKKVRYDPELDAVLTTKPAFFGLSIKSCPLPVILVHELNILFVLIQDVKSIPETNDETLTAKFVHPENT